MRNHSERFAQLRHDALWHQCHAFNWDLSGGELHIIADELDYWGRVLRLPLQKLNNYRCLRTQYHNMKRMGYYCGHSRGIPPSCQSEERMSHPAVAYFVQQWRGRTETTTSATKLASIKQIAELHLASNGPNKEAMHPPPTPASFQSNQTVLNGCVFDLCRMNPTTTRAGQLQKEHNRTRNRMHERRKKRRGNGQHHRRQRPKERKA